MEDLHLSSLPTPFSPSLLVSSRVCTAFQQVIPSRWKGEVLLTRQGYLVAILVYAPLPSTTHPLNLWHGQSGEAEAKQNAFFQDRLSNPLVRNLGSGRPMLPSLDSAFLPFKEAAPFFVFSPPFLKEPPPEGERQQAIRQRHLLWYWSTVQLNVI